MVAKKLFNSIIAIVLAMGLMVPIIPAAVDQAYAAPDKPTGLKMSGTVLSWDAAAGADDYDAWMCKIADRYAQTPTVKAKTADTYYDFETYLDANGSGTYFFLVVAYQGEEYTGSDRISYFYLRPGDEEVTSLSATVTAPAAGALPDTNPVAGESDKYSVSAVKWTRGGSIEGGGATMEDGEVFSGGQTYVITVTFTGKDGYGLNWGGSRSSVTLNGQEGLWIESRSNNQVIYRFAFTVPAETFTVTFDANGHGSAPSAQTVEKGKKATEPTGPTAEGWSFGGWYTEAACTNAFDFSIPITGDITLFAKWTANTHAVTFDSNGGEAVASQTVNDGDTAWQPFNPERTGWYFDTWCSDSALTKPFDFSTPITEDTTLYARWYNALSAKAYDSTNGTELSGGTVSVDGSAGPSVSGSYYENASVTLKAVPDSDYVFVAWKKGSPTGTTVSTSEEFTLTFDGAADYYAVFAKKLTYTLTAYDVTNGVSAAGGKLRVSGTSRDVTSVTLSGVEGESVGVNAQPNEGYHFAKWVKGSVDGETASTNTNLTFTIAGDVTYYALFEKNAEITFAVTFDANGHGTAPDAQTVNSGGTATEPTAPTESGWSFDGWYTEAACTNAFDFSTQITSDITLFAKWTEAPEKYPVRINIGAFDKDDNFIGANLGGTAIADKLEVAKGETVNVTVTPDTGYEIKEIAFGNGITGYQIGTGTSWTVPENFNPVTEDRSVVIDVTFKELPPAACTVTFDANGHGTAPDAQTVSSGGTATEPTAPTVGGWQFGGWYTEAACTNAFDFSTPITGDITLFAKWSQIFAVNVFDDGNATLVTASPSAGTEGTEVTLTATPKGGFQFKEWQVLAGGVTVAGDKFTIGTADVQVKAIFEAIPATTHTVTFDSHDGSAVESQSVADGDKAVEPANPTKPGFVFDAWYVDDAYTAKYDFSAAVTGDITLHARWMYKAIGFTMNVTGTAQDGSYYVLTTDAHELQFEGDATTYTFSDPILYTDAACQTLLTAAPEAGTTYYALVALEGGGTEEKAEIFWSDDMKTASTATASNGATMAYVDLARSPGGKTASIIFSYTEPVPAARTVTFDANGHGTAPDAQTVSSGGTATEPTAPTVGGWQFGGWYTEAACTNAFDFSTPITGDITLFAKWSQIFAVNVFDDGNATLVTASPSAGTEGTEVTLTATPKGGFQFKEWQVLAGGVTVAGDKFTIGTADVQVKAIFEAIPATTYSIKYDLNGGTWDGKTGIVTLSIEENTAITLPAPTREGYTFDYWEGSRYEAGDSYTVVGDHTFTAQWKENEGAASGGSGKSAVPSTGDSSHVLVAALLVAALGSLCALVALRRSRKAHRGRHAR